MSNQDPPRKLRILMLHGYTQSGPLFHAKTRALEKNLQKAFPAAKSPSDHQSTFPGGVELVYPTAPIKLSPAHIPGFDIDAAQGDETDAYGWWVKKGDSEPYTYEGIERGLETVAEVLRTQGPFTGVIGFSQGGALAGMVASLLEPSRRDAFMMQATKGGIPFPESFVPGQENCEGSLHPPLEFAVSYSGFGATTSQLYMGFYEPKIATPMLHFLGSVDTVVEEMRSLRLVDACVEGRGGEGTDARVVYHPGGHFLPSSQKQYVAALVAFIKQVTAQQDDKSGKHNSDEDVEDMDMPF